MALRETNDIAYKNTLVALLLVYMCLPLMLRNAPKVKKYTADKVKLISGHKRKRNKTVNNAMPIPLTFLTKTYTKGLSRTINIKSRINQNVPRKGFVFNACILKRFTCSVYCLW